MKKQDQEEGDISVVYSRLRKYNFPFSRNECAKFYSLIFAIDMEVEFKHFKSYRYEVLNASPEVKTVLYVLHGYGQLVKFFIRKFKTIPKDIMIVAPEGMHRFYLNGNSGRVGASWMTKEAREADITDNVEWLNELDRQISNTYLIEKRILLGFSQGGATAARWEMNGNVKFDELILWACVFPPDLERTKKASDVALPYFVIGSEDEFYDEDAQQKLTDYYRSMDYTVIRYSGKHDIHSETLNEIIRQMN
jgi:predicted esterase